MKLSDIRDFGDFRASSRIHLGERPRIGLTMFSGREGGKFYTKVQYNYVQSITDAGGIPVLIPSLPNLEVSAQFAAGIHGLILSGGEDISPLTYGAEPRVELGVTDLNRDRWELALLAACEERKIPIFGICRGFQIMNVHRGGTLYQDLPGETGTALGHAPFDNPMESLHHSITIEPDSALGRITESSELLVNSFHHQAVKTLGRGLKVSARSPDKIIEAAEDPNLPYFMGVQFHAEALPPIHPDYLRLFSALIAAAEESAG